ncbi:MoaD/ThiS family protein [Rhodocyclus purpureus]|uniref:MoaD/ThiS family protein n=1 Tax=Rhodocyclus purpureus TaxID=1067 RepID=UPI001912BEF9|nr:MoaD/ThiS family protein [Rhodocyclus purpureus]MBK5913648.1 hypothetical protein [Rhodocyclus purpureus]
MSDSPDLISLQIRLFGAFRSFHNGPVQVSVAAGSQVAAIKAALADELKRVNGTFDKPALLAQSALATDSAVLADSDCLHADAQLAILPPVCGG